MALKIGSFIASVCLATSWVSVAHGGQSGLTCPKIPGYIQGPFVPDKVAAKRLFVAHLATIDGRLPEKSEFLEVVDRGTDWELRLKYAPADQGGRPIPLQGAIALTMKLDKCTGAVVEASRVR